MKSFDEFWPQYLTEHAHPKCLKIHLVGMSLIHVIFFYVFVTGHIKFLWLIPLLGLGFPIAGHYVAEQKRPLSFRYPLWSAMAYFRMFYLHVFKKI